ncbi:PTS sugar transporter subunit IIA [Streptococcus merionis]|uniref:PTS system transporter subunit IIA n=1 Tax=Streptococcus merionis TaxID=400065 RepID=A0A239SV22_9STRE|nr:fructose PTS transporter subunit IIA [Streptococcus merionis]SNU89310.1 PTS system transporter subunit IIA [Streptococcus merionis]
MEIKEMLDPNLILTNLEIDTKDQALKKLSQCLSEQGYVSNVEEFIEDIYRREAEGQTGIGNYIAIPHSKSAFVNKIGVAIGINKREIPWESLDDKGAKVIILFSVGDDTEDAKEHLKLLSLFARKLGNDAVVEQLLKAQSVDDVINAFA